MIELMDKESEYLLKLLEGTRIGLLHELHHAATHDFKEKLKKELELIERLRAKLSPERVATASTR